MSETLRVMCNTLRLAYVADVYETVEDENSTQYLEAYLTKNGESGRGESATAYQKKKNV